MAMAAGVRQHGGVLLERPKAFRRRRRMLQRLRQLGRRTDHVIRTGGLTSFTYGEFASGVDPVVDPTAALSDSDSPAEIRSEVRAVVQRWRWRRIEMQYPQFRPTKAGDGGDLQLI